ncbi:MAG: cobalamin-dependent protein [Spirochaetia bacterium]|nr:cobalamin-dependent protein [Spirochaetia bacterium]
MSLHGESLSVPVRATELRQFYSELFTNMVSGKEVSIAEVLQRSRDLQIRPVDLLIGMLQPALYQIGDSWAEGTLSVSGEHAATAIVTSLVEIIRHTDPARKLSGSNRPDALLINADGNYHTLGLSMIEALLAMHGYSSQVVVPGIPVDEIIHLAETSKPIVLGISISMKQQMQTLEELDRWANGRPGPIIVAGGFYVRNTPSLPLSNIRRARAADDLLSILTTLESKP